MVSLLFTCTLLSPFAPGICVCPPPWPVDVLKWPPFSRVLWLSTMLTTCPRGAWSNPYRNAPSSFWDRLSKQEQKGHSLIEKRINKETQHVGADFFCIYVFQGILVILQNFVIHTPRANERSKLQQDFYNTVLLLSWALWAAVFIKIWLYDPLSNSITALGYQSGIRLHLKMDSEAILLEPFLQ